MAKTARAKKTTAPAGKKVSKSASIRTVSAAHKTTSPKEIVALLKEDGIAVSPALVSNVLTGKKKAKGKGKGGRPKGSGVRGPRMARTASAGTNGSASQLDCAMAFIDSCGGISQAQETLNRLAGYINR